MTSKNSSPPLAIVIPARNEEAAIIQTLKSIERSVSVAHQIIIVNDNSTDQTKAKVEYYSKTHRHISIYDNNPQRAGFANAIKLGLQKTTTRYIVLVMADLCDQPATINKMYYQIQQGFDLVAGSRYIKGGQKISGPKLQGLFSSFVCRSLHLLTGVPTRDVTNAFKMYRTAILNQVYINPRSGVEASMEITLQLHFQNYRMIDIPTRWRGRTTGRSKFKFFQRAPRYLKIYLWAIENTLRKKLGLKMKPLYKG